MGRRFDYQIDRRADNELRAGYFALQIDGVDADICVNPSRFMPKATRMLLAAGMPADPVAAAGICDQIARRALERRVERLRGGLYTPANHRRGMIDAGTEAELAGRKRVTEEESVHHYLNRGKLKGLTNEQRVQRRRERAIKHDCTAEWIASRMALIAKREEELRGWEAEEAAGNPKAAKMVRNLRREVAALKGSGIFNATHGIQDAYVQYLTGGVDLENDDVRIWPLMTNTTLDTVRDAVDQFSDVTADEFDGANYSSGGLALDSPAVAVDDANDRAEFDATDETVSSLGAGTRSIQGVALGIFNTNTAGSRPLHWIEFASNKTPDGSNFTFVFNAEGILQMADG